LSPPCPKIITKKPAFRIYLCWEGDAYPLAYLRNMETLLHHHPGASIEVYSNTLPLNTFIDINIRFNKRHSDYLLRKDVVRVVRYNLLEMTEGSLGHDWAVTVTEFLERARWRVLPNPALDSAKQLLEYYKYVSPHLAAHLSDFLRMFLLYKHGGL